MKLGIIGGLLIATLAFIFCVPAQAQDSGTICITMTGVNEISISLDKIAWEIGEVPSNTVQMTDPPIEWCTLTVGGNCNVNTFIVGEDAKWVDNPGAYKWTLSSDGANGEDIYGLWFRISGDTTRGYVPITKIQDEFWPYNGGACLEPGDYKQFGLKLVTPSYFYGNREMETHITISAVAS